MNEAQVALGVDAGGTATRWTLVDPAGAVLAGGETAAFNGHVFDEAARAAARASIAAIAAATRRPGAIVAGVTGLPPGSAESRFFVTAFAEAFAIRESAVVVASDLAIAYRARFRPGEGILVYAGTGSISFHLKAGGEEVRAGGYGAWVDDAGSAWWIAMSALRAVLRAEDVLPGSGWASPLGRALGAAIGSTAWSEVRAFVYGGDRGRIGLLARDVAGAAREGDAQALRILEEAGRELARLALALRRRLGPLPVALAGGATRLHPAVAASFGAALPGVEFTQDDIDASLAAARLALETRFASPPAGEAVREAD